LHTVSQKDVNYLETVETSLNQSDDGVVTWITASIFSLPMSILVVEQDVTTWFSTEKSALSLSDSWSLSTNISTTLSAK
jgi:hypothetical protein